MQSCDQRAHNRNILDFKAGHDNNGHVAAPGIDDQSVEKRALVPPSKLGAGDYAQQDIFGPIEHRLDAEVGNDR
jgi:hypothetical protein